MHLIPTSRLGLGSDHLIDYRVLHSDERIHQSVIALANKSLGNHFNKLSNRIQGEAIKHQSP